MAQAIPLAVFSQQADLDIIVVILLGGRLVAVWALGRMICFEVFSLDCIGAEA